jgi:CDP-diacylglycerol--glycerol-3-phosphate 3-phosphatidyltransferase
MDALHKKLPNLLTLFRLVLATAFFIALNQYRYAGPDGDPQTLVLWVSIALFLLAALTDWLDGYLARRWHAESTFGRIMDPFCDKVLVLGAFIYLAGPRFVSPDKVEANDFFNMISGVYPWMVVVVVARELLVTSIRGEVEAMGVKFGANLSGKLKMILQSIAIPVVLLLVWLGPEKPGHEWVATCRDILVYLMVAVTILSGWPYITSARAALRSAHPS